MDFEIINNILERAEKIAEQSQGEPIATYLANLSTVVTLLEKIGAHESMEWVNETQGADLAAAYDALAEFRKIIFQNGVGLNTLLDDLVEVVDQRNNDRLTGDFLCKFVEGTLNIQPLFPKMEQQWRQAMTDLKGKPSDTKEIGIDEFMALSVGHPACSLTRLKRAIHAAVPTPVAAGTYSVDDTRAKIEILNKAIEDIQPYVGKNLNQLGEKSFEEIKSIHDRVVNAGIAVSHPYIAKPGDPKRIITAERMKYKVDHLLLEIELWQKMSTDVDIIMLNALTEQKLAIHAVLRSKYNIHDLSVYPKKFGLSKYDMSF